MVLERLAMARNSELEACQSNDRPPPVLLRPGDAIGLKQAQHLVGRDAKTLKRWCRKYGIGFNVVRGAEWEISAPGAVLVRHADWEGLELLRSGKREHPRVKRVLDHLGIEP